MYPYKLNELYDFGKVPELMELHHVMELHVIQNELVILCYKHTIPPRQLLLYSAALNRKF